MKRRDCLTTIALMGIAACTAPLSPLPQRTLQRIGVQLFTLRESMAKDVPATLTAVAAAGYDEVETAGTGNMTPQAFAHALADSGLTAPSAHVPLNLLHEQPEELLESAETIGYRYLVVPWLPPEMRTLDGYLRVADLLNRFGEQSAAHGIQTCYHNHDFEFEALGDQNGMQLLLDACDPRLVKFELDLYWTEHAGIDPAAYLAARPGRFPLCHVKDRDVSGNMVDVGDGEIDFSSAFAAGTDIQHYFVEHDRPADPLRTIRRSITALRAINY